MSEFTSRRSLVSAHLLLWLVLAFVLSALYWAQRAEIDEVTRGTGKVIPSGQVQVVQNLEGGIISEILVREGDIVERGDILLRIDDTRFASSYRESQLQAEALTAKIARLQAEASAQDFILPTDLESKERDFYQREHSLFESRRRELEANLDGLRQQQQQRRQELKELQARRSQLQSSYTLAKKELKITAPLVEQGVMSEIDLLRLKREVNDLKGEMEAKRLSIPRVQAALQEIDNKIAENQLNFRTQAQTEFNDLQAQLSRLGESNLALEDRVTRTTVRSPVKGTVKRFLVNTVGGVVQPGMDLVEIVPLEEGLLIEAQIRPADIAFLHPGQNAMVKFSAYDYAIFGGLPAQLEHISADSLSNEQNEAYFLIRVRTERNYLGGKEKSLPVIPGMTASVDILTGRKTILDYLLKPLNRAKERALRER